MVTRIHHLNCGTMRPQGSFGGRLGASRVVTHCLLVERDAGLVLVDTGFGLGVIDHPKRLGRLFLATMRPALEVSEAALTQVTRLGYTKDDVTDIVLTHMDRDHAGGLADFPNARVHVDAGEYQAAHRPHGLKEKDRYVAAHWAHHPRWELHGSGGDDWFGFEGVRALGDDDVVLVPLRGHSRGHVGVAVRRPEGGWLLDAGDAYFDADEARTPPAYKPGLVAYQKLMAVNEEERQANQARLRELRAAHDDVEVFCSHSVEEFERLAVPTG